jgi:hypothetical protein
LNRASRWNWNLRSTVPRKPNYSSAMSIMADSYESADLSNTGDKYRALIPAEYTKTEYPIEYYVELRKEKTAAIFPGLGPNLINQPYFVVRRV